MAAIDTLSNLSIFIPWLISHENVWSHYDQEADVLYLHFTKPNCADDSEMTEDDIIIRYEKGAVIGLTILNVSQRGLSTANA